jgi:hypothetical protein
MPDQSLREILHGEIGGLLAALVGAFIRGVIGPGRWSWAEFVLASFVGASFALWVAPAVSDTLGLGQKGYGGVCLALGMTALPITRGLIALARAWGDDPLRFIGKGKDR